MYNRGHPPASCAVWLVGIIERTNDNGRRCVFLITQNRSARVLVPFIKKWVAPGSILLSDEWKGYGSELDQYYFRATVNHSKQFGRFAVVNGKEISVNTNHIEREWREVRKVLQCHQAEMFKEVLNREIFRHLFLAGKDKKEWPNIFLRKMAEVAK